MLFILNREDKYLHEAVGNHIRTRVQGFDLHQRLQWSQGWLCLVKKERQSQL